MLLAILFLAVQEPAALVPDYPDRFGASACLCGDLDGDGRSEFAVVADRAENEPDPSVWVFAGATGELIRTLRCGNRGGGIGIARVDDVDGDRVDDLAISCCHSSDVASDVAIANDPPIDMVEIHSGRDGTPLRQVWSAPRSRSFGDCIERMDDVDGDGRGDVLVSSFERTVDRVEGLNGRVVQLRPVWRVHSSVTGRVLGTYRAETTMMLPVPRFPGTAARLSGCGLGDLDDDCSPDFAVVDGNAVVLVSTASGAPIRRIPLPSTPSPHRSDCVPICNPGDLDGDGCADVVIAGVARTEPIGDGWDDTAIRAISSRTGRVMFEVHGWNAPGVGRSLAPAGDCDGDGVRDILVSQHAQIFDTGRVWVISGRDGQTVVSARLTGHPLGTGLWLSGDADADGDGLADILATNFYLYSTRMRGTGATVYSGIDGRVLRSVGRATGIRAY